MSPASDLPASQVALDTHASIRQGIEKANLAIYEVIRMIALSGQPIGANLFGVDAATLRAFGNLPKSKIMPILQTGLPIFELRLKSEELVTELTDAKGFTTDRLFALMVKSFDPLPPLTKI